MAFDAARGTPILVGGIAAAVSGETWALAPSCGGPSIAAHPRAQISCPSGEVNFSVTATGSGTLSYQWQRGTYLWQDVFDGNTSGVGDFVGANTASLAIHNSTVFTASNYRCVVSTECGSVPTEPAQLTIVDGGYANCDLSITPPVLNVNDFQCFLSRFAAGDTYANCDGSTALPVLNVNDFQCFLNKFAAGCP